MSYGVLASAKLVAEGRFEEAIPRAGEEIAAMPGEPEPHFTRAQALAGLGRFTEAVADYQAALAMDASTSAMDPEAVDDELFFALRSIAQQQKDQGGVEEALRTLERYREILPEGRHLADVVRWSNHVRGVEEVWYRERA
jgi:tetratricopeptide (TPR) repeat protein